MLSSHHRVVCLLVSSQAGAQDMSHMMFNAPGVNFVLVNPVMHDKASTSCVSLRVLSGKLNQLWRWLLVSSRDALLSRGLIGLALHGGTFLWLRDPSTNTHGQLFPQTLCTFLASCILILVSVLQWARLLAHYTVFLVCVFVHHVQEEVVMFTATTQ